MTWLLLLTVCANDACYKQSVQAFPTKAKCLEEKIRHEDIPIDGSWSFVGYSCRLKTGVEI